MGALFGNPIFMSTVLGAFTAVGRWVISHVAGKQADRMTAALDTFRSLAESFVLSTSDPTMTAERMAVQLRGLAYIQLARVGIDSDAKRALASPFVDKIVAEMLVVYHRVHPSPTPLPGGSLPS